VTDHRTRDWLALIWTMSLPSFVTLTYFVLLRRQPAFVQQTAYAIGKTVQFAFPAFWVFVVLREKLLWNPPSTRGLVSGIGFGALVLVAAFALYHGVLQPRGIFDTATVNSPRLAQQAVESEPRGGVRQSGAAESGDREVPAEPREAGSSPAVAIRSKIRGLGVDRLWKFIALGAFYAVFHSLLEEYYWRWFVFQRLQRLWALTPAIGLSSIAFMAHHVILMAVFFGWSSPWTYFFSLSVAVGGAVWAWLYARSGSIYAPWLSHLLVDAAIFSIGYDLAKDLLG
jgi:uncharacterized protein